MRQNTFSVHEVVMYSGASELFWIGQLSVHVVDLVYYQRYDL